MVSRLGKAEFALKGGRRRFYMREWLLGLGFAFAHIVCYGAPGRLAAGLQVLYLLQARDPQSPQHATSSPATMPRAHGEMAYKTLCARFLLFEWRKRGDLVFFYQHML